jgi:hypothetical protein
MRLGHPMRKGAGGSSGVELNMGRRGNFMNELHVLYTFLALMTFNLLASFVYILGFNNMKTAVKKAVQKQPPR